MSWLTMSPSVHINTELRPGDTVRLGIVCPDSNPTATSENAPFGERGVLASTQPA
jgi:hypothetical protein